ncbi:hypothetical protein ABZ069_37920 [Streptomyces microflavus]|uniref:hypothetical protein n=1 Tax=Streptomyces microflavus TaxID=1919 RepID=UPI0033BE1FA1
MQRRYKHRSQWRPLPLVSVLILALALYSVGLLDRTPVSAAPSTGAQLLSVGNGQTTAAGGAAPQVSPDGRYAVFQSAADLPSLAPLYPRSDRNALRVYGRDLRTGAVTLLSDPSIDATAPRLSADGRVVTYRTSASAAGLPTRASTVVVDRDVAGRKVLDQTGNVKAYDLGDAPGAVASSFPSLCASDCGPHLSDDGSTVVHPSVLSPVSPYLEITAAEGRTEPTATVRGNVVNFDGMVAPNLAGFSAGDADYTVTVGTRSLLRGQETKDLTGQPVVENTAPRGGPPAFSLGGKTCQADGRCRIEVTFHPSVCGSSPSNVHFGHLRTNGEIPAGQSTVGLVAMCVGALNSPWCASAPDLTPQQMADLPLRLGTLIKGSNERQGNVIPVGSALPGSPFIAVVPASVTGEFSFGTEDCSAIRLVDPGPQVQDRAAALEGVDAPAPIVAGQSGVVDGTFYLLIDPKPQATAPDAPGGTPDGPRTYTARFSVTTSIIGTRLPPNGLSITVQVERRVIEMRKDAASTPGFVPGPATVTNRATGAGSGAPTIVDGIQPALSADGTTLVFARPVDPSTTSGDSAVLRVSLEGGQADPTEVVVADGDGDALTAPAVSRDGTTLAFVRTPRPASGTRPSQIVVTDARGRNPRVVSTNADGSPGDGDSSRPALSPDGGVVGFASTAANLGTPFGTTTSRLYVRAIADAGTLAPLASLSAGEGPAAAFDAGAARAFFASPDPLAESDTNSGEDAYAQPLSGRLTVNPSHLDFGVYAKPSLAGTGLPLSLTNAGPGPVTVDAIVPPAVFQAQSTCTGRTLSAGESCTTVVSFTPATAGTFEGILEVRGSSGLPRAQQTTRTTLRAEVRPAPAPSGPSPAPVPSDQPTPPPTPPEGPDPAAPSPTTPGPDDAAPGTLSVAPSVAHPGRVTQVHGRGFTPNTTVSLTWGTTGPVRLVTVTGGGTFTAYVPVGRTTAAHLGTITAAGAGRLLAYVQFLVQRPSMTPSLIGRGDGGH